MGSETHNYHREAMARRGFPEAAARIGELWRAGRKDEAVAAVPDEYLEQTTLARLAAADPPRWEAGVVGPGVTGVIVGADQPEALALMAELAGLEPRTRAEHRHERATRRSPSTPRRLSSAASPSTGPAKRNAISALMRVELLTELRRADDDPDVRVSIIRGLRAVLFRRLRPALRRLMEGAPIYSAPGDGQWARQATDTWFSIWDLAHPVIAQVHGYAIAGGTELASACDLVYVAADAAISYPVVRVASPPDWQYHTPLLGMRRAMELMLTGDPISGDEAARIGFANRAYPPEDLEERVLAIAERIAGVPKDLTQINKRSVHRSFDVWGARAAIRAGTELQALAGHTETAKAVRGDIMAAVKPTQKPQGSA